MVCSNKGPILTELTFKTVSGTVTSVVLTVNAEAKIFVNALGSKIENELSKSYLLSPLMGLIMLLPNLDSTRLVGLY